MRSLLIDDYPMLVLPTLAEKIGLNEAIFLQQVHFWINRSGKKRDGREWVYNTLEGWTKQFPFWSMSTVRRTINSLEKQGLIFIGNYNKLKMDKTKWYAINHDEVARLSNCSKWTNGTVQNEQTSCSKRTDGVVQNEQSNTIDYTQTNNIDNNIEQQQPSISNELDKQSKNETPVVVDAAFGEVVKFYEQNIGIMTPFVSQELGYMVDDLNAELTLLALKESVLANARNKVKYAQSILNSWKAQNFKTAADVENAEKRRTNKQNVDDRVARSNLPDEIDF